MRTTFPALVIEIVTLCIVTVALVVPIVSYTVPTISHVSAAIFYENPIFVHRNAVIAIPAVVTPYVGATTTGWRSEPKEARP